MFALLEPDTIISAGWLAAETNNFNGLTPSLIGPGMSGHTQVEAARTSI